MKKIRCALYDRVSTDLQVKDGLSLEAQRDALTNYALSHGYEIVDYYTDEGITARKNMQNRKELVRLLNDVKADKIDLILVTKLDRWFRNIKDYHNTQAMLEAHNGNWKTIFEQYDTSTSNGRFAINIMLSVNENECDRDSERIREVFAYKRRNGDVLSGNHVSFGYRVENKKFVKDDKTRHIVEDFFSYYFTVYSKRKTMDYILTKYGPDSPAQTTLQYMFKNPVYYGHMYGRDNFCEPYISKEQFDKIKETGTLKTYTGTNEPYIFSSLIKCPFCGKNFSGYQHKTVKKSGKTYISPVYHCKQKNRAKSLCRGGIELYESTVEKYMLANVEQKLQELSETQISFRMSFLNDSQADPAKEIEKLKKEMSRLNLLFQKGRIEENYYDNEYDKLTDKIREYKALTKDLSESSYKPLFEAFSGDWQNMYHQLDKEHKRAFWHDKIKGIYINPNTHKICGFNFLY